MGKTAVIAVKMIQMRAVENYQRSASELIQESGQPNALEGRRITLRASKPPVQGRTATEPITPQNTEQS
jgi:hypothetical protein